VDAVREVLEFPQSDIEPAPHFGSQELTKFITGLAKKEDKVYILVNITHLFGTEDWHSLSQVGAQAA
ncbi:MAG: chemotaxis protein CheW, partial [Bdellovibrionaceae bacterium]|nr:chemotaxis protein CheW [Pseudobdellovibrionaceae bacterium]